MPQEPRRILVIDDELQIRKFLRISLRAQGYEVTDAGTGREGLEALATRGADLVVLDLGLPDIEGHEVLVSLREWTRTPVIVLSVRGGEREKVKALDSGANDYITKPFGIQEFMARIRVLLREHQVSDGPPGPFDDGVLRIDFARRSVALRGERVHLTRKEYGVLAILAGHAGRVVTQQQLLRELWGPEHVADTHYLRIVVGRIRQKLGEDPAHPRYLHTEPGVGYQFLGGD